MRRGPRHVGYSWWLDSSEREGDHLFEPNEESQEIRAMYEAELKKEGSPLRMKPVERR